jgi:hypothetical protein
MFSDELALFAQKIRQISPPEPNSSLKWAQTLQVARGRRHNAKLRFVNRFSTLIEPPSPS